MKHQPTPWSVTFNEAFPFGYKIHDAAGELVMSANAVCHSSKQKTLEDNRNGVGFKGEGDWSRESAIEAVAQQEATARYIVASANACKGNSVAWLEGYGKCLHASDNAKPLRTNLDDLTAQRDELLAALKPIMEQLDGLGGEITSGYQPDEDLLAPLRSVITKCEVKS